MSSAAPADPAAMLAYCCQVCGKPCDNSFPCSACSALYYCSAKHQRLRQRLGHDAEQCSRMRQQLARSQEVLQQQLQWPAQTAVDVCNWLQQLHCHAAGLLQHCCPMRTPATLATHQQDSPRPESGLASASTQQQLQQSSAECAQDRCLSETCSSSGSSGTQLPGLPSTQQEWEAAWAPLSPELLPAWGSVQQQNDNKQAQHQQQPQQQGEEQLYEQQQRQQNGQQVFGQHDQQQRQQLPCSWSEYYQLREIPVQSPAALALHFPLTLWYCLAQLLPAHGWPLPAVGQRISIMYLGPQSEVLLLPVLVELAALLPQHHLDIHMIGPDVPEQLHARACTAANLHGGLTVSCWAGCFHDIMQDWAHAAAAAADEAAPQLATGSAQEPAAAATAAAHCTASRQHVQGSWGAAKPLLGPLHLVFAADAGLPAFPAWMPTLRQLLHLSKHTHSDQTADPAADDPAAALIAGSCRGGSSSSNGFSKPVPVVFSDYCEEAAVNSQQMVQGLLRCGFDLQCQLNPFRQPVGLSSHGTRLPACSNGFLFGWL